MTTPLFFHTTQTLHRVECSNWTVGQLRPESITASTAIEWLLADHKRKLCGLCSPAQVEPQLLRAQRDARKAWLAQRKQPVPPPPLAPLPPPPPQPGLSVCYARNRRVGRRAHLVLPGEDRTLCGVLAGDPVKAAPPDCFVCRERAGLLGQPGAAPLSEPMDPVEHAIIMDAEAQMAGPPLVQVVVDSRLAHVIMKWNPLLVAVVRNVPGSAWVQADKQWTVPESLADEVVARLRKAGAEVRVQYRVAEVWRLLFGSFHPDDRPVIYDVLSGALRAGSQSRAALDQAWKQVQALTDGQ